jgi:hypothetical protein
MAKTDKGQGFAFPGGVYLIVRAWRRFDRRSGFTTEKGGRAAGPSFTCGTPTPEKKLLIFAFLPLFRVSDW